MAATANLNLTKIAQTDYLSSYPTTHNANMDAIDEAITDNADEFAAYAGKTDKEISDINSTIDALKPEGTLTLLDAYPIGSIYMSVNSTSPAELFGGTWEEIAGGRVLMGQNSTYAAGSTGGATTHTHTGPAHTHAYGLRTSSYYGVMGMTNANGTTFDLWNGSKWVQGTGTEGAISTKMNTGFDAASATKTLASPYCKTVTGSAGTGNTGNASSLMPYLSVYMWTRTA